MVVVVMMGIPRGQGGFVGWCSEAPRWWRGVVDPFEVVVVSGVWWSGGSSHSA